ncbi:O-acyltransferase like protein [Nibea albiflora]|uniref:O-acyltransferase like protein n=1 Tax=Nibea albiflora TaxID=240163 RepID=A0ACB7FCL0_NIBAL|nr:O-acyltransferase like protein [Nibea albiflora]
MQSALEMALSWVAFLVFSVCSVALENTQASTVSQRCTEDTNTFLWEINQDRPKEYAVLMYDAFGKMGSNVEGGNANRPGLLQQCRSAHAPTFSGQYCQVFLRQGTVQYFEGVCVPDSCGEDEVQMLVLNGQLQFGQTSLVPPLPHILSNDSTQELIMTHCLSNAIDPDASDVTCLFVCCVMVAIPLAATLFTAIIKWQRNREVSPTAEASCLNTSPNVYGALKTNGSSSSEINSCTSEENSNNNYKNWRKTVESNPLHVLSISGPVFLAVDTFLLLGGLLSARSLLGSIERAEDKLSLSLVANYLFKRIKRIQPLHLFIMCLTIGLISLVQWGPYWFPFIDTLMDCKSYWWANLLLISNLLPVHEIWQAALGWFCCLSTMAVLVGLAYVLRETPAYPSVPHALYQGLHRPLWALAVTWIILACEEGYGGFIKSLLSLGFWVPLSNISFACYLTHPVFIIFYIGLQETPIHYTDINFMYLFLGHLVLTLVVSYVFTVLIEKPYLLLHWNST